MKKKNRKPKRIKFNSGDIVVFDPSPFNPEFWKSLSEKDKKKYYGRLGYGAKKTKLFVFLSTINCLMDKKVRDSGHCVLLDLLTGKLEVMCHTSDFRYATEDEW